MAELQARLQAFDDLIESCLREAGVDTEAQESLARLVEQVHARQQEVQGQMQRISAAPTEDWDSRLARLEAVWSQLDRTARIAMRELALRPRPEDER